MENVVTVQITTAEEVMVLGSRECENETRKKVSLESQFGCL